MRGSSFIFVPSNFWDHVLNQSFQSVTFSLEVDNRLLYSLESDSMRHCCAFVFSLHAIAIFGLLMRLALTMIYHFPSVLSEYPTLQIFYHDKE